LSFLCDDAYISFRYARNLVLGHGLVFNLGERVEGYTNFLWVLELAGIWKALGIRPEHSCFALSVIYTAGTLLLVAMLAKRTPFRADRLAAVGCSLFLLAVNRSFAVWTTGGLETRQFTYFALLAIWFMQRSATTDSWRTYAPASLAWAAAELTRPEGLLLYACAGLWLLGHAVARRRLRQQEWAGFVLPFVAIVAMHFAFRYWYYGDWLPNTYYAKDVRPWPAGGFSYLTEAFIENGIYLVAPIAVLGLFARLALGRDGIHVLSAVILLAHAAYLVRIGGDHFEFRPLDFWWPLLSVAVADGLLLLRAAAERWFRPKLASHASDVSWFATALAALVVTFYSTVFQLGYISQTHDVTTRGEADAIVPEMTEQSFPFAFLLPGMRGLAAAYNEALKFSASHMIGSRYHNESMLTQTALRLYGPYIGKTDGLFPADAVMRYDAIGVVPYSLPDLTVIDVYGLTDRVIARTPVRTRNRDRWLAHDRSPPPGYLQSRGVNLEVLAATEVFGPSSEYALRLEDQLWMPLQSTYPEWLRAAFKPRGLWWKHLDPSVAENHVWVSGKALEPIRALGFFDQSPNGVQGMDEGWIVQGPAMISDRAGGRPRLTNNPAGYIGNGFINSFDPVLGDNFLSDMRSPVFTPVRSDYLTFLIGGGSGPTVGVELLVDSRNVETWHGEDSESLGLRAVDLTPYAGKRCQLHVFDAGLGAWAHVTADQFLLLHEQFGIAENVRTGS
jgi:arabinofuranosyltransferase